MHSVGRRVRRSFVLLGVLLPFSTSPPQVVPTTSIRGTVYADDTGAAAQGVSVTLTDHSFGLRHCVGTVTSDENGAFHFTDPEPAPYTLDFSKDGYLSTTVRAELGKTIVVRLQRVATVSGRVTDAGSAPLDNALVEVMKKTYMYGEVSLMSSGFGRTDNHGLYRVSGLPPGRYYVRASCDNHETVLHSAASGLADARSITLTAGSDTRGIDFRLRPEPRFSLSGHLIDAETNGPARAAFLRAYSSDLILGRFADGTIHEGQFQIEGLSPGRYFLSFDWVRPTNNVIRTVVFPFEMGDADQNNIVLTAMPRVTVSGRLKTGGALLPHGLSATLIPKEPAANARVGGMAASANVNDNGTFKIIGVQAGDYHLCVHSPMPPQFFTKKQDLVIDGRAPVKGLELELDFSAGAVSGTALDSEGKPMPGVIVVLQSLDGAKRADDQYRHLWRVGESGEYSITGVVPGEYLVFAWRGDSGLIGDPDLFAQATAHANRVRVAPRITVHCDARELSWAW